MKRTLYSLMLSENVVHQVDQLAHKMGIRRSALINQILADYVDYTTPERRIHDVFSAVESLVRSSCELVPFVSPNTMTMSLKSSLEYKYRPTVKYEVELYRSGEQQLGALSVIFRTQSAPLIEQMTAFFRLWKYIEDQHLAPRLNGAQIDYILYDGRFVRSICRPQCDCTAQTLAEAISSYIQLFDRCMKGFLAGRMDAQQVEQAWLQQMSGQMLLL